jgi:hypothetical protein
MLFFDLISQYDTILDMTAEHKTMMEYRGYIGHVEFDNEAELFHILSENGLGTEKLTTVAFLGIAFSNFSPPGIAFPVIHKLQSDPSFSDEACLMC